MAVKGIRRTHDPRRALFFLRAHDGGPYRPDPRKSPVRKNYPRRCHRNVLFPGIKRHLLHVQQKFDLYGFTF
jgi:hypothetical protein